MKCYQLMVEEVKDLLSSHKLPYDDTIIIGDNSSGKSEILLQYIQDNLTKNVFFIDAVNRYFDIMQVDEGIPDEIVFSPEIIKNRLAEDKFNLEDINFANGRDVCNYFEKAMVNQANRLSMASDISNEALSGLELADVQNIAL